MIKGIFIASFVMSLAMLVTLVSRFRKHISIYYPLLFCAMTISNLGSMQLASADNLSAAVYANQVIYLGASFAPFLSYMCVADLCKKKPKQIFASLCLTVSVILFCFVSTIGSLPVYYKDVTLVQTADYSYLEKEYGPLHTFFPVYMLSLSVAALVLIISSFKRRKQISYVTSTVLTVIMLSEVGVYIGARITHAHFDLLPAAFVVVETGILILLDRIKLYDVSGLSAVSMTESMDYGFLIFTEKYKLAGADEAARKWFPEINSLFIDQEFTHENTDFFKQVKAWLYSDSDIDSASEPAYFERDGKIIGAKHFFLSKNGNRIHCITLSDDTHQQKYAKLIEHYNEDLEASVNEKTDRLKHIQDDIILSMASIVENRDNNTGGHVRRTSDIVRIFVKELMDDDEFADLTDETAECIIKAAPLHDFGKIAIPDVILNKPGKFTDEEYEQMKKHSEKGAVIVAGILQNSNDTQFKRIAENVAHYHHEKFNGRGYPTGIKGEEIPFEARVMALADVFDALVSKRVYKERFSYDKAFDIIRESSGEHFDPVLCAKFLECRPKLEQLYNSYTD